MATATILKDGLGQLTIDHTPSGAAVVVDQVVVTGDSVGVAKVAIADGATGTLDIGGSYTFPKVTGAVIVAGETVDWDVSAGEVDDNAATPASGDCSDFGVALESAGSGVLFIDVQLLPGRGATT